MLRCLERSASQSKVLRRCRSQPRLRAHVAVSEAVMVHTRQRHAREALLSAAVAAYLSTACMVTMTSEVSCHNVRKTVD